MHVNFLQLSYFRALAKAENLSSTAEQLFISPPALRASISRLEKEMGTPLFDKVGNRICLNEKGRILLEHTENIFAEMECAVQEIKTILDKDTTSVSIATTSDNAFIDLLAAFGGAYPELTIAKTVLRLSEIRTREVREKFDFLITSPDDITEEGLEHEILYEDDYPILMVYPEHPLADRKEISLRELKDEWFVALSTDFSVRKYYDTLFKKVGLTPQIRMECDHLLRIRMVEQQFGVAMITARAAKQVESKRVRFIPVAEPIYPRVQAIFWHPMRRKTPASELFYRFVKDYFKKTGEE